MKHLVLSLILLVTMGCKTPISSASCDKKIDKSSVKNNTDNMREMTLIFSISGCTRAHIISINSKNDLNYRVGGNMSLKGFKIKYNDNYKIIRKTLSEVEAKRIRHYYLNRDSLLFNDVKNVKDSWEYYLYINGKRIAFGSKVYFDDFPLELKECINYILGITGKLYDIPGMS